jgi:hypothetical protein
MNSNTLEIDDKYPNLVWAHQTPSYGSIVSHFPKSEAKDLVYIKTPDEKFHAVYDKTSIYMDVFERTSKDTSENSSWPYDKVTHLFTLRRDDYHNDNFYPIFYKVDDEWRLIFNRSFEGMSVYELPSSKELFRDINPSEFLGHLVELDVPNPEYKGRFYFAFSWIWGRHETPAIIDMESVARKGKCNCAFIMGKYVNYIYCNDDFDKRCLDDLYVSKIENDGESFAFTFEVKEGVVIDLSEFNS